jgi:glycosyltransferase involved in cell wall biosynthesis|tara:strand:+ start:1924 stop:2553 length:630 start_codon:yes stop_codon:yes gene_type:complete
MKISYAITVCNEHKEIEKLLTFLFEHKRKEDQVIVQMDFDNATTEVVKVCEKFESMSFQEYKLCQYSLNKNFAEYKNNLNKNCDGDWIFQIDADEIPNEYLIEALPFILETNSDVEAYWVPRVNTVAGITDVHIAKWGWKLTEDGWVNFPDWQMRIYKNNENIYWVKPVHEQLKGYTKFANLPPEEKFAIYHPKDIGRQEKQNAFYDTI